MAPEDDVRVECGARRRTTTSTPTTPRETDRLIDNGVPDGETNGNGSYVRYDAAPAAPHDHLKKPPRSRCDTHATNASYDSEASYYNQVIEPEQLQLASQRSLALPFSYFSIGVAQSLFLSPLTYYLVAKRNIGSEQMSIIGPIMSLPWCLKIAYGMLTDTVPIRGERRRPYFVIGWVGYVLSCLVNAAFLPSIGFAQQMLLLFVQTCFYLLSDVISDTLVVERSNQLKVGGQMQATCYLIRFTGSVIGTLVGTFFGDPETYGYGMTLDQVFVASAAAGALPLVFAWWLAESPTLTHHAQHVRTVQNEVTVLVHTLSQRAVYRPMFFIFVYNILQWGNAAWNNFLVVGLDFKVRDLGMIAVGGSIMNWAGVAIYRKYFVGSSWRAVYLVTSVVSLAISCSAFILILRWNRGLGIGDLALAAGDATAASFVSAIQFLPTVVMYISLCPEGSEGSAYALLTTMSNLSGVCGSNITTLIAAMWPMDISNAALRRGDFTGMLWLSVFTTVVNPVPLLLLHYLPASRAEQDAMKADSAGYSPARGWLGLYMVAAAIVWSLGQNALVAVMGVQ